MQGGGVGKLVSGSAFALILLYESGIHLVLYLSRPHAVQLTGSVRRKGSSHLRGRRVEHFQPRDRGRRIFLRYTLQTSGPLLPNDFQPMLETDASRVHHNRSPNAADSETVGRDPKNPFEADGG